MTLPRTSIDVCVCTYRRQTIADTIRSIAAQRLCAGVTMQIIVADNDETPSAADLVREIAGEVSVAVIYLHAPARNISLARNACLDHATGDWVAFIDDDEIADDDWLQTLLSHAEAHNLSGVFGPALAQYDDDAPDWIRRRDYHSNHPQLRDGVVQTGHTCNGLMRRTDPAISGKRFLLSKGLSGGEDTEFFFRAWHDGARFGIVENARVYERVAPARLDFAWIAKRKFRSGQSYGYHAWGSRPLQKWRMIIAAAGKMTLCAVVALGLSWSQDRRNYWSLRGIFHAGVVSSSLGVREDELY